jgi:hypothetical protein
MRSKGFNMPKNVKKAGERWLASSLGRWNILPKPFPFKVLHHNALQSLLQSLGQALH